MILRYLLYGFLIYLLYRFVFHFMIPVALAARKMRKQFRHVQEQMQQQQQQHQQFYQRQRPTPTPATDKKSAANDDYIDFEEVK